MVRATIGKDKSVAFHVSKKALNWIKISSGYTRTRNTSGTPTLTIANTKTNTAPEKMLGKHSGIVTRASVLTDP